MLDKSSVLAALAALLFGAAMVVARSGFRFASPIAGASISIPTSGIMMWALSPLLLNLDGFQPEAAAAFAAVGLVFPALVTWLSFTAAQHVGPTVTSSLASTVPVFAIAFATAFLGEPLTLATVLGVALITLGVFALSKPALGAQREWPLWLLTLPLLGSALRGATVALSKFGLNIWPQPFAATLIGYSVSSLVVLGLAYGHAQAPTSRIQALPRFATVGIFNGTAVLLMYSALARGNVGIVSSIVATSPLFALLLSALFLKRERMDRSLVAGALAVAAGVAVLLA